MSRTWPQDMSKTGQQLIVDLVNALNATNFTVSQFTFGTPEATPEGSQKNTMITLTPTAESGLEWDGPKTVYYDRLDLAQVVGAEVPEIEDDGSITTTADLFPALDTLLSLTLTTDDIQDLAVDTGGGYPAAHVVRAQANSLKFFGLFSVSVVDGVPN